MGQNPPARILAFEIDPSGFEPCVTSLPQEHPTKTNGSSPRLSIFSMSRFWVRLDAFHLLRKGRCLIHLEMFSHHTNLWIILFFPPDPTTHLAMKQSQKNRLIIAGHLSTKNLSGKSCLLQTTNSKERTKFTLNVHRNQLSIMIT